MTDLLPQVRRFLDLARHLWQSTDPQAIDLEALPGGQAGSSPDLHAQEALGSGSASFA
jgi:hypothetical protein